MSSKRQAYIFDFDGVLVDSMPAHLACYKQALEEAGVPIDEEQFYRQAGMTGREQIAHFARRAGVDVDVEAVYRRNRELKPTFAHQIRPIEVNIELLRALRRCGHPVAIASGSSRESVVPVMDLFRIEADTIVTGDEVEKGKPNPALFLEAAARLAVEPDQCTVIEDSDVGIEAAQAANMKCMRFVDNVTDSESGHRDHRHLTQALR